MQCQIVIIIGLCGSGKSTLSTKYQKDYIICDDFISKFYNGQTMARIIEGKRVCLIDPRLSIFTIFEKYIKIIEKHVCRNNIQLILFENDPQQCLINITHRPKLPKIEETIIKYSEKYLLTNYYQWQYKIIPVWKPY